MSGDPTVMELIYERVKEIDEKLDRACSKQTELMVVDEQLKAKIAAVEIQNLKNAEDVINLRKKIDEHERSMEKHYNPYYNETITQKLWRKKPEIAAGGGVGLLLYLIVQAISAWIEHGGT